MGIYDIITMIFVSANSRHLRHKTRDLMLAFSWKGRYNHRIDNTGKLYLFQECIKNEKNLEHYQRRACGYCRCSCGSAGGCTIHRPAELHSPVRLYGTGLPHGLDDLYQTDGSSEAGGGRRHHLPDQW